MLHEAAAADKAQAVERGMPELAKLCSRRLAEILQQIDWARRAHRNDAETHKERVNELAKKGFTESQIAQILAETPEPLGVQEHYLAVIQPLEEEQAKLEAFPKDCPRYDQNILIGTQFEYCRPEKAADFDAAATALAQ